MQAVPAWKDPEFDFIKSFVYDLGKDDLIAFGAREYESFMVLARYG